MTTGLSTIQWAVRRSRSTESDLVTVFLERSVVLKAEAREEGRGETEGFGSSSSGPPLIGLG